MNFLIVSVLFVPSVVILLTEAYQITSSKHITVRLYNSDADSIFERLTNRFGPKVEEEKKSESEQLVEFIDYKPWRAPKIKNLTYHYKPWSESWQVRTTH